MKRALLVVVMAVWALSSSRVAADDREEEARSLFVRGVELSETERWGEALEYFRRSRELVDRPSTVFNMAVALLRLGRPTQALAALDDYLRATEADPEEAERRAEATRQREDALTSIVTLLLEVEPPNAEVRVDGVRFAGEGSIRELALDPGTHIIRAIADGHEPGTVELSVLEGERTERAIALVRLPGPTGPARVHIAASVASATIRIDDEIVGEGRWEGELVAGAHRVDVSADGFAPFRRDLTVEPEQRLDVQASLERLSGSVFESPWLWIALGFAAAGGAAIAIAVAASSGEADPYGGTTGVVLFGLER